MLKNSKSKLDYALDPSHQVLNKMCEISDIKTSTIIRLNMPIHQIITLYSSKYREATYCH